MTSSYEYLQKMLASLTEKIKEIENLHSPMKFYAPYEEWEDSYYVDINECWEVYLDGIPTENDGDAELGDPDESKLHVVLKCKECSRVEKELIDFNDDNDFGWVRDFDYPCLTIQTLKKEK